MPNCKQCSPDPTLGSFIPELKNTMKRLEAEYEANGEITWQEYSASWDQPAWNQAADDASREANQKKVILLKNSDFKNGTLRITTPCKLKFTEDVFFNANAGVPLPGPAIDPARALDWFPDPAPYTNVPDNEQYQQGDYANGYRLGFFAGIAIEAEGVIVDLDGWSYQAHDEFNLMQRFFALFTLNDQPLPPQQGPGNFGGVLRAATKLWIKNGRLGTSHHNIQGNDNRDVWLQDLVMKDHEVAAVSLNGSKRVYVDKCEDQGNKTTIPVLGTFSALRFSNRSGERADALYGAGTVDAVLIQGVAGNALTNGKAAVDRIFNDVIYNNQGVIDSSLATGVPAHAVFQNWKKDVSDVAIAGTGLLDGPAYSMNFHPKGVAVGDFIEQYGSKNGEALDIVLEGCKHNSIVNNIVEVPAAPNKDTGARMTGVDAMPIQLVNQYLDDDGNPQFQRDPGTGAYVGGALLDLQIALAVLFDANPADQGNVNVYGIWALAPFVLPDADIRAWAQGNGDLLEFETDPATDRKQLKFATAGTVYPLIYAGDGLHHVIKGCTPIRMDAVSRFLIKDCTIWGAQALAGDSSGFYLDSTDGGNQLGMTHKGNWSGRVQCIRLSTCADGALVGVMVRDAESYYNQCLGIEIAGESANIVIDNCRVANIKAGTQRTETTSKELNDAFGVPNPQPLARGIKVESQAKNISVCCTEVDTVENYEGLRKKNEPVELGRGCVTG